MSFFKMNNDLAQKVKLLEDENNLLGGKIEKCNAFIDDMKREMEELKKQKDVLMKKYEETGIECSFCHITLQNNFKYCPNCGKTITYAPRTVEANAERFKVEQDREDIIITGYTGFDEKRVVIPGEIDGRKVVGIWNEVFYKCETIEEIIVEEGCQYIGNSAFSGCKSLNTISLPKTLVEIGKDAFQECGALREIVIPVNVIRIGSGAFSRCTSLTSIILPPSLRIIESYLLNKTAVENIDIPNSVKVIESYAFSNTPIKRVVLPQDLYGIGSNAFNDCYGLTEITMHSNIKVLGGCLFANNKLYINCAAGSKAQLYARKYSCQCREIAVAPESDNSKIGVLDIFIFFPKGNYTFDEFLNIIGYRKAEAYSCDYNSRYGNDFKILKPLTFEETMRIKKIIEKMGGDVLTSEYDKDIKTVV